MASKEGLDINCQVLLEHQADPNAYGNDQYHKTPIHRARSPKVKNKLIIGLVLTNKIAVGCPSCSVPCIKIGQTIDHKLTD